MASTSQFTAAPVYSTATAAAPGAGPTAAPFGQAPDGTVVQLFTLTNAQGARATISTYGGALTPSTLALIVGALLLITVLYVKFWQELYRLTLPPGPLSRGWQAAACRAGCR